MTDITIEILEGHEQCDFCKNDYNVLLEWLNEYGASYCQYDKKYICKDWLCCKQGTSVKRYHIGLDIGTPSHRVVRFDSVEDIIAFLKKQTRKRVNDKLRLRIRNTPDLQA